MWKTEVSKPGVGASRPWGYRNDYRGEGGKETLRPQSRSEEHAARSGYATETAGSTPAHTKGERQGWAQCVVLLTGLQVQPAPGPEAAAEKKPRVKPRTLHRSGFASTNPETRPRRVRHPQRKTNQNRREIPRSARNDGVGEESKTHT